MGRARECILTFHGVGDPPHALDPGEASVWLTAERFLEILDVIKGRANVRITFDDGNASDALLAAPALNDRNMRATFFVCSERLGTPGYLTDDQIRSLSEMGHSIGSHGARHVPWRGLDAAGLRAEIADARSRIETSLGAKISEAACPFGAYDRRSLRALRAAGFARVYTSDGGCAGAGEWLAARTTVMAGDSAASISRVLDNPRRSMMQRVKTWMKAHR